MRKIYISFLFVIFLVLTAQHKAAAQCTPGAPLTFTNSSAVAIPTGPGVITSTITVSGAPAYLYDLNVQTFIQHTFASDLDITIQSPSGKVVTLTTDNGAGNDDVFNGTVWDDNANPGGQVPYTTNNGVVTDHSFTNLTVATPLAPEEPLGAFVGENPNGVWTITVSDDLSGDGGSLNSWSLIIRGLATVPTLATTTGANSTPLVIPTGPGVVSSTITISGAGTQIADVNVLTNILHTFNADLDITLMSPAGTIVTLTSDNGAGNDNVFAGTTWDDGANPGGQVPYTSNNGMATDQTYLNLTTATPLTPEEPLAAFIGENPNGVWTLTISDDLSGDGGSLNNWSLDIKTATCTAPCVSGAATTYTNSTPAAIPTGPGVITSTITVSGAQTYLYDLNVQTFIQHTFAADLDITIQSPSGRVVTLTSDNGAGNDNVFNGTVWDDNSNPGGQVPYATNNGVVSDHAFTNLVVATPLAPEEPLGAFVGENPNGVWTITVSDDLAGDGGSLDSWSLIMKTLPSTPVTVTTSATNSTPTAIPTGPGVITSTITIAGAGTQIFDVNMLTNIQHTFNADLDITLMSPAGTVVTISTDNGVGNDDVFNGTLWDDNANPGGQVPYSTNNGMVTDNAYTNLVTATPLTPEEGLAAFIGENPNGVWTLTISDDLSGDGGSLNSWGLDIKTSLCGAPSCSGTPTPGTVSGTTQACNGSAISLTVAGHSTGAGLTLQWQSASAPGGPFSPIAGATTATLNTTATGVTTYYIATTTCSGSGLSASTPVYTVTQSSPVHSNLVATVTTTCAPGAATVTGVASAGSGNFTHTLTGPGTIVQNPPSGPNNGNASFTVTNLPAGFNTWTLTSTDAIGCSAVSLIQGEVFPVPVVTITPPAPVICRSVITQLTASVSASYQQLIGGGGPISIPGGAPGTTNGNADLYPATINVSGYPATGVTVRSVRLNGFLHSFPDDVDVVLVSPTGTPVILMSDCGGATPAGGQDFVIADNALVNFADNALNNSGTYKPTNYGTPDNFPAPGPGNLSQATPTLSSFTGDPNGAWKLYIVDDNAGNFGQITNWSITFNVPAPVVFSPVTNLYTDAAATIPYAGQPVYSVYTQLTANQSYTATATVNGCTGNATVNVTVNQPPVITVQPTPATQLVCPGAVVSYTVNATGTSLTYQWRRGGVALVNGGVVSGATTPTLTLSGVSAANAGNYDVVVTGVCSPAATSTAVTLNIGSAPVITTAPANASVCQNANASFTVTPTGTPDAPFTYLWQVSTDAGVTWNTAPYSTSNAQTLVVLNVQPAMNNNRYRVIVTNSCGQSTTSASATLTVNATPVPTVVALPTNICISDTVVNLSGSPIGGSWSGIGVSGLNFIPTATAIGTYTLTYTYTNTLGCTGTATTTAKVSDCPERERLMRDNAVLLYPNPNSGLFYLRMNSTLYNYLGVRVYNQIGQLVSFKTYNGLVYNRVVQVDLRRLPAGVYNVNVFYDDGARTDSKMFHVIVAGH
ncbi:MAG: proprotein convertase P-domain-containing protein [Chitinophagaceae bacterium]|nr:proprotein convertase P-domain-containing protein [Chitinophagaceae bacterium]